jgi:hypothetical protein
MWFQGNSAIFAVAAVGDVRRLTSSATMAGAAVHLEDSRLVQLRGRLEDSGIQQAVRVLIPSGVENRYDRDSD